MTISIFDCCDVCDAALSDAENAKGKRFDQTLCDHCADGIAKANPDHPDAVASSGVPAPTGPVTQVCSHCGSDDVVNDAVARWDIRTQTWMLSDLYDDHAECCQCEGETTLRAVAITAPLPAAGFTAVAFADFVVTHGHGDPLPEAYDVGRQLMERGDDIATAAAEVVARGLTTQPGDSPGTYTVLIGQADGHGELHVSVHEADLDEAKAAALADASRQWERPLEPLRVIAVIEGDVPVVV